MLILLLATLSRCASPDSCPSNDELLAAVRRRDNETTAAIGNALRADDSDAFIVAHSERILRISDIHCDEPRFDDSPAVNCTYVVTYPSSTVREVATLNRSGEEWLIISAMTVTLRRRNPD